LFAAVGRAYLDNQRQCNVSVLPPDLAAAYNEFMAG
jgi:hypothetical protein